MNCESAQQNIILLHYGELPDELQFPLEQHLDGCEDCRREWKAVLALEEHLAAQPVQEPSPNFIAASRMRLDEALDGMPARSLAQRFLANSFRWLSFVKGSPALATLLLGVGFLGGNVLTRYQAAHEPKLPTPVILKNSSQGAVASVSGITQTPNSEIVEVKYNRLVPESVQGSLDDPQIRHLLMLGTQLATTNAVHADSVALLASECAAGHRCDGEGTDHDVRNTLLVSLRYDKSAKVRETALDGLQSYVGQDRRVRDAVLETIMHDGSEDVRQRAIAMLQPVQADASVRQVLRTVSTEDVNPAVRNASFQVLQGAADIQ